MNYQFITVAAFLLIMVALMIVNIATVKENTKTIRELKEGLDSSNQLQDQIISSITKSDTNRVNEHAIIKEILSLIRKNTNKSKNDGGFKKEHQNKQFSKGQKQPNNK